MYKHPHPPPKFAIPYEPLISRLSCKSWAWIWNQAPHWVIQLNYQFQAQFSLRKPWLRSEIPDNMLVWYLGLVGLERLSKNVHKEYFWIKVTVSCSYFKSLIIWEPTPMSTKTMSLLTQSHEKSAHVFRNLLLIRLMPHAHWFWTSLEFFDYKCIQNWPSRLSYSNCLYFTQKCIRVSFG